MRHLRPLVLGTLLLYGGCRSTEPLGLWYGPQTPSQLQRQQAQNVDPYPATDTGPPVVGGRPQEYDAPYNAPRRLQRDRWIKFPGL
jgi:hypothetical protein